MSAQDRGPRNATVLVVDDEDTVRLLARRMLEEAGYVVYDAPNGFQALSVLVQRWPVDVVVADIRMPIMDGREFAQHLGRQWPNLPILFISGYDVHVGDEPVPGRVLPKPFGFEELTNEVERLLLLRQHSA
jgi:two-component system cell cycle sensor histidine kinase/response regulator CckA